MPKVDVIDSAGSVVTSVDLAEKVFSAEIKKSAVHQVVIAQMAGRRAGTASTKTRREIRGGGAKPWKQKGTGRARAGTNRSPLWRGGGIIFGPKPRDYSQTVTKKMRKAALTSALTAILQDGRLVVVDSLKLDEIKTKKAAELLAAIDSRTPALVVYGEGDANFIRSASNIPYVKLLPTAGLNVYDLLRAEVVIITADALDGIEKRFEG
jgi:large subunit ribosomal protein L4